MADEFQESDVFWPEQSHGREGRLYSSVFQDENVDPVQNLQMGAAQQNSRQLTRKKKSKQKNSSHSLPVSIPCMNQLHSSDSNDGDDDLEEDPEMVPPHLIVAGRLKRQMAFSVQTGNGRTLKGRDLRRVRNSILRMTGFLET
ncbi:hypothetical protein NE237_033046 [Protea cynaroides]|uniref:Senescence regulator S40 n=1 Tax=Protea cynaroides TaxID=273540 RepID=A0A9Q0L5N5_9MAGN|nr:hypothetical protein NE237_033046 [Protea cynaroides]